MAVAGRQWSQKQDPPKEVKTNNYRGFWLLFLVRLWNKQQINYAYARIFKTSRATHRMNKVFVNPIYQQLHEHEAGDLIESFPELQGSEMPLPLSLHRYLSQMPYRWYSRDAFNQMNEWLCETHSKKPEELLRQLTSSGAKIDQVFIQLAEINRLDWHDLSLEAQPRYEFLRHIIHSVHPAYLQLIDGVFSPLLLVPAQFSRENRGKKADGLDIFNIVEELNSTTLFPGATRGYHSVMRNGIAHGGIQFVSSKINYADKKGNTDSVSYQDVVRRCDSLLDICNGLALALSIFLSCHRSSGHGRPQSVMLEELVHQTKTDWWSIELCVPSTVPQGSQLEIFVKAHSSDPDKIRYSAMQTGVLAEALAPGFDRYFVSIQPKSGSQMVSCGAFDGGKLSKLRQHGAPFEDYGGAVELELLNSSRFPKIFRRIQTLISVIRVHQHVERRKHQKRKKIHFEIRQGKIHRNSWGAVLQADVVIASDKLIDQEQLKVFASAITRCSHSFARKESPWWNIVRYLPLGFSRVSVYQRDMRRRQLTGYGLGDQLVCTIQKKCIRRIQSPDIIGGTIEYSGSHRIAWNRLWLQNQET